MEEIRLTLELYRTDGQYGAYLSDDTGGSGICVEAETKEELIEELMPYIKDYLHHMDGDNETNY